ncbi:hypothetical protein NQ318_013556 [Aromia moschata]|uniref:Uncharacterized protein n=1 Tax=Aromia moschata TaxID=1265417 RepID=A0AAV8XY22_9CUCU|nr:hypothetical protein NQ318_013556 [Aromia moschata]
MWGRDRMKRMNSIQKQRAPLLTVHDSTSRTRGYKFCFFKKCRHKEDRKKIDLREGGHYEIIALMRALYLPIY